MPSSVVKSFAQKSGKSVAEVEALWQKIKGQAQKSGKTGDNLWSYVTGTLKKILKIQENTMDIVDKYLITEAKVVEFDKKEIQMMDRAFKRNYSGELESPTDYGLRDDGSSGMNEEHYINIMKYDKYYLVYHVVSDEDGDESNGHLDGTKDRNLKSLINKILRRI